MAITKITTSGTFNLKNGAGYCRSLSVSGAGTTWTIQFNDGPDPYKGNVTTLFGATPVTITSGMFLQSPLYFTNGFQVVTSGATPGEIELDVV